MIYARWIPNNTGLADGVYAIRSKYSNRYIESGAPTLIQGYNYGIFNYQKWRIKNEGNGYSITPFTTANNSNLRVDVWYMSSWYGTEIKLYDNNGSAAQRFHFPTTSGGARRIAPVYDSNVNFDVKGPSMNPDTPIQIWTWANCSQQEWIFEYLGP